MKSEIQIMRNLMRNKRCRELVAVFLEKIPTRFLAARPRLCSHQSPERYESGL